MKYKRLFYVLLLTILVFLPYRFTQPHSNSDSDDSLLTAAPGIDDLSFLSELEKEVIRELNIARTKPKQYANFIEDFKRFYAGKYIYIAGQTQIITKEGVSAVNEAIEFLRRQSPVPALKVSRGLSMSARDHVEDQGPTGNIGHNGSDNSTPSERMNRFGNWTGVNGENIEYGNTTARHIVMHLIIDDGVPSRGHRKNIYKEKYKLVGVSCGPHHVYGNMCVMDFASSYIEKDEDSYE